jgi:hypothetical protein
MAKTALYEVVTFDRKLVECYCTFTGIDQATVKKDKKLQLWIIPSRYPIEDEESAKHFAYTIVACVNNMHAKQNGRGLLTSVQVRKVTT